MIRIYFSFLFFTSFCQLGQAQAAQYQVKFDAGQTAISLAQLDSIKALVRHSKKTRLSKIRVLAYAYDAQKGDTNEQLSRRRAYLIQQCLEREGVPLSRLHIQNIVCDATTEVCAACANLSLEYGDGISSRNSYTQRNREFLYEQTVGEQENFWIDPMQENFLVSKDGILIHLPANTLVTSYNSRVQITLKVLDNTRQNWWNGLATVTNGTSLEVHKTICLKATQEGAPLPTTLRYPVTVILPNQDVQPEQWKLWQQQEQQWKAPKQHHTTALFLGDFYENNPKSCESTIPTDSHVPDYGVAPKRPIYINLTTITASQDAAILVLEERLKSLEALRYNRGGKKEIWTKQQKQRAYQLNNQKSLLLVTREKLRREAQNKNIALEEAYYRELAQYNQKRHQLQTNYIKAIEQQARSRRYDGIAPEIIMAEDRCLALQHYERLLQAAYDTITYQKLKQHLIRLKKSVGKNDLGYWIKSGDLGWLALGKATHKSSTNTGRFFAQSSISPYKITAYYYQKDGQVFSGQPQEDGRLVFVGIDPSQSGEVLAVSEEEDKFLLALQSVGGKTVSLANKTVELQFEFHSLQEALQHLSQSGL